MSWLHTICYFHLFQMSWLQTTCYFHLFPRQLSVSNVLVTDYLLFPSVSQTTFCVKCLGYRLLAISICFPDNFLCQMCWLQTICCFHLFPRQLSVSNVLVTDYLLFPSVSKTTFCVKCLGCRLFAISICLPDNFLCQMSWLQTICYFHLFTRQLSVSNVLVTDY